MNDLIDILVNFGGGKGGEASGTVVRFLLPTFFWLVLAFISGSEWRSKHNRRDMYMALAALAGTGRELLMFLAEYGSSRGYVTFDIFYRYYPPLEHAATLMVGILIAYAFMRYGDSGKKYQTGFLTGSIAVTVSIYLVTAVGWPDYLLIHPRISFGLYWGDLAFRLASALILGTALVGFILDRMRGSRVSLPLISGISFLFLDELLMIINIATAEQYVSLFAPVRHNLHIWAIPFFIATYWSELKFQSKVYENELEDQHQKLEELNLSLAGQIRQAVGDLELREWFSSGQNELNIILRGDKGRAELAETTLSFLIRYLGAGVGVFYGVDTGAGGLEVLATFAIIGDDRRHLKVALGEGIAGQVAKDCKMIHLTPVPKDYLPLGSPFSALDPLSLIVLPVLVNNELLGVVEIGSFSCFTDNHRTFLHQAMETIAIVFRVTNARQKVNELLEQTQAQTEELRVQQEELQQTNEELEERAQMLELQREQIRAKNREVEEASHELQRKADELERISTYKSEFLANMSHELRTPLNSLMILSSLLRDNREGNLTGRQVEFAATINGAGRDLLNLINDILDLSKIESGHLQFVYENISPPELCVQLESVFLPIAGDKGIELTVSLDESTPETITTDGQRTQQILKNLLSNACKFTRQGTVSLHTYTPKDAENPLKTSAVAFAVTDTGIGIPFEKQSLIFNAFQQADGSTSRTYGGTGLGLSISRQLARSMGGEISLVSEAGTGSTFTLYLPVKGECSLTQVRDTTITPLAPPTKEPAKPATKKADPLPSPIPDDRNMIEESNKSILIIEDDLVFAGILVKVVRARGFSALVAAEGESGIAMAERYHPSAILLDVMLPNIDGWGVMRSLKDNPVTRHIPVHFITCLEERQKAMSMGAIGFVTKPISSEQLDAVFGTLESAIEKTMKMLLIVEDDQDQATALVALLEERNVTIKVADSGTKAIKLLSSEQFDCIVLDLGLADMGAFELLEELKKLDPTRRIPVIIHTGRELSHEDEKRLHHYAESIIIKGAKSPERLLNEVSLFLHLIETSLDPGKQRMIRSALDKEAMLEGKKVLIVDDDMRNIFSLSSALAEKDIIIFEAENGREALHRLDEFPDIDLVLMDIMMPEMDGYEAMRCIRKDSRFHNLPIIALTAKAMKGDREECLKAGASDYIPKPVDMDKLFSLLRVWLYSTGGSP